MRMTHQRKPLVVEGQPLIDGAAIENRHQVLDVLVGALRRAILGLVHEVDRLFARHVEVVDRCFDAINCRFDVCARIHGVRFPSSR